MNKNDYPQANEHFHNTLCHVLDSLPEREESKTMKKSKSIIIIAAAAAAIMGITVFAGNGIRSYTLSSSSMPTYESLPTAKNIEKDFNFKFTPPEKFSNGYEFNNATKINTDVIGEGGSATDKFKEFKGEYTKGGKEINLYVQPNIDEKIQGEKIDEYNGTAIYYSSYMNKVVPPDYILTEEDKKAEENGDLVFSYGSDSVNINTVEQVFWTDGNLKYSILMVDNSLDRGELIQMIHEVIDIQ